MYTYLDEKDESAFVEEGVRLLPMQFARSENIQNIVNLSCERVAFLVEKAKEIANETLLETAYGAQLEEIGGQLNIPRLLNQTDEQYRSMLWMHIYAKTSGPSRDEVVNLLKLFTGGEVVWLYKGAGYTVDVNMYTWCIGDESYSDTIRSIFPVNTDLRVCSFGRGFAFGFEGTPEVKGFGSTSDAVGFEIGSGGMASLLFTTSGI